MKKTLGGLLLLLLLLLAGSALGEISTNLRKETTYNPDNKKVATETYLDDNGNPVIADDKGYCTVRYTYGVKNRVMKIELLDESGQLVNGKAGYAYCEYTYSFRQQTGLAYYDVVGRPARGPQGYHREETAWLNDRYHLSTWRYDTAGNPVGLHRLTEYVQIGGKQKVLTDTWYSVGGEMAAGPDGYARLEYDYVGGGASRIAYFNADGSPFLNTKAGYAAMRSEYDKNGRVIKEWYTGRENELIAGPYTIP